MRLISLISAVWVSASMSEDPCLLRVEVVGSDHAARAQVTARRNPATGTAQPAHDDEAGALAARSSALRSSGAWNPPGANPAEMMPSCPGGDPGHRRR